MIMGEILNTVYSALQGGGTLVLGASFLWGIIGMLFSPCSLIAIPLVIGYIESQEEKTTSSAALISIAFSLGIFINIAIVGTVIASAGTLMTDLSRITNYIVAVIFILFGLHLMEVIRIPWINLKGMSIKRSRGLFGAWLLGTFSGMAIGPCSFAYLAPMLVLAMKAATGNFLFAFLMVLMYALGNCLIIIIAGTSAGFVTRYMNFGENSNFTLIMNRIFGVILILVSLYFIYSAP